MSNNPYAASDRAIQLLNKKAVRRFEGARRRAALLDFDELNVIHICRELYAALAADNQRTFLELARMVYEEADPHGELEEEELWELWLLDEVLGRPNEVTHYTYAHEAGRKRDRLAEAVSSATQKKPEFQRALRYWSRMTGEYCDIVTDKAALKAYRDAGVKKVRWRTEEDDRVCEVCGPRDKQVYDIDKVPPKPHWGCRCWLEAAG